MTWRKVCGLRSDYQFSAPNLTLKAMPPRIATFIGYGALAATLLFVAIFALIAYVAIPRHTGGIDGIEATVTWISVGLVILALIAVHIIVGRGLLAFGRGVRRPVA